MASREQIETRLLNCPGWWTRPPGTPGRLGRSCKTLSDAAPLPGPSYHATTGPICAQEGVMAKRPRGVGSKTGLGLPGSRTMK
jgi:hypothetical protein